MSLDPDEIPEGLLTLPLNQLDNDDLDALRQLQQMAERQDWDGLRNLLINYSKKKKESAS